MRKNSNLLIHAWVLLCFLLWGGAVAVAGLVLGGCAYDSGREEAPGPLRISFLDVGQGLAVLLEKEGRLALYDTGPDSVGVVDSLLARGVDSLDWVLISHGHRDHAGGFLEMSAALSSGSLRVGRLLVGPDTAANFVNDSVLALARRFQIPVDTLGRGDSVWFADGVALDILWPTEYGRFGENRASVVMKVSVKATEGATMLVGDAENAVLSAPSLLLTGDLDSVGESRLLELSPGLSADLLQVAHHGSSGSSTLRFLSQVAPRHAVISVGAGNRYGHPTREVLQKLLYVVGDSAAVFRTDLQGSVEFEMWPGIGVVVP